MEIKGYLAAQIQSLSDCLDIPVPLLIQKFIYLFTDDLENEDLFKLLGVSSEEEANQLYEEVIEPVIITVNDNSQRRFRVWYDDRTTPTAWVVDGLKEEDLYGHPFIGRWEFSQYNTMVGVVKKALELGVKPEEIYLVQ